MAVTEQQATDGAGSAGDDQAAAGSVRSPALVGRDAELSRLVAAVLAPPSVVTVEGEAGIGKTRLVTELLADPAVAERLVLVGDARAIAEPFPLGPLLEGMREAADRLAGVALSPVAGALRPLLPELGEWLPPATERLEDRAAQRHRVFRGLRDLLAALCPAVLVLEDLHWADPQTVEFLRYAVKDLPAGLSLVVTFRAEEVDAKVRDLTARLPAAVARAHLRLGPLDRDETGQLAAAIAGTPRVSAAFAGHLCARTGGLPFAVEEVMALLRERGEMTAQGERHWVRETLDDLAVPVAVRDHVLARVALMPARTRSLLDVVAVLHDPAPEWLIGSVSRRSPGGLVAALRPAIRSGLVVDRDGLVGFRHTLAAQAVYEQIPGPDRRMWHQRAAVALREQAPQWLGQIAHHLRQAGLMPEWAEAAEEAADQAEALGNHDEAGRLLEQVLRDGSPDDDTAGRLAVKLGRAAVEMLRAPEVDDLLSQVLEQDLPRTVRGELQFLRGALLDLVGLDPPRVRWLMREAVDNLSTQSALRARAMVAVALRSHPEESFAGRKQWLDRALALVPEVGDPQFEVFLLGKVGSALVELGSEQWREIADRIRASTPDGPQTRQQTSAWYSLGCAACRMGHHEISGQLMSGALAGAVRIQDEPLEVFARSALLLLDYSRGVWEALDDGVATLLEQLDSYPACGSLAQTIAGGLALARGDLDEAAARFRPVLERQGAGWYSVTVAAAGLARLALARGDPAGAAGTAQAYVAMHAPGAPLGPVVFRGLPWLVEALVAGDRSAEARTLVLRCAQGRRQTDAPLAPAALRHARGVLALADGKPDDAAHHFHTAGERYEEALCPYEAALAREQAGSALLAAGGRDTLEAPLQAALATYERLGASWDLGRAARVARQHGLPVPGRHRGGPRGYGERLSPREQEVAGLAATGRSNQEIAEELFVTAETVKKHLTAVMRKVGVRSRSALAHHLTERRHAGAG